MHFDSTGGPVTIYTPSAVNYSACFMYHVTTTIPGSRYHLAWWMLPDGLLIGVILPALIAIGFLGPSGVRGLDIVNHITWASIAGLSFIILFMALGSFLGRHIRLPHWQAPNFTDRALTLAAALTFVGYTVWFAPLILNPSIVIQVFLGQIGAVYQARNELSTVPGITTLTESGVAYVVAYGFRRRDKACPVKKRFTWYLIIIIALGAVRVFANSERLALLELVIPYIVVVAPTWVGENQFRRKVMMVAPLFGLLMLILIFAGTEYFRSWINFYSNSNESLLSFTVHRLIQYYTLALNTGLAAIDKFSAFPHAPYFSLVWLYKLPLVGAAISDYMGAASPTPRVLALYGDEQFTNFSGLVGYIWDFGWVGATIFLAVIGFAAGAAARSLSHQTGWLRYFYPMMFMAFVAILRIPYLTSSGMFVSVMTLILMILASGVLQSRHNLTI